ncbi:TPA: hypothetical protein ACK0LO_000067 [Providencia stuartii]
MTNANFRCSLKANTQDLPGLFISPVPETDRAVLRFAYGVKWVSILIESYQVERLQ